MKRKTFPSSFPFFGISTLISKFWYPSYEADASSQKISLPLHVSMLPNAFACAQWRIQELNLGGGLISSSSSSLFTFSCSSSFSSSSSLSMNEKCFFWEGGLHEIHRVRDEDGRERSGKHLNHFWFNILIEMKNENGNGSGRSPSGKRNRLYGNSKSKQFDQKHVDNGQATILKSGNINICNNLKCSAQCNRFNCTYIIHRQVNYSP